MVKYKYTGSGIMSFSYDGKEYTVSKEKPIVEVDKASGTLEVAGMELVRTKEQNTIKNKKSKVGE